MFASWQENCDKPRQCVEKQRYYSVDKDPYSQVYGNSQVYGLPIGLTYSCKNWTIKKAECQRIDVFEFGAGEDS